MLNNVLILMAFVFDAAFLNSILAFHTEAKRSVEHWSASRRDHSSMVVRRDRVQRAFSALSDYD